MDRRGFLATTGIALFSGCTFDSGTENMPNTETPVSTKTPTDDSSPTPDEGERSADRVREADGVVDFETADLTASLIGSRVGTRTDDGLVAQYALVEPATADSPAVVWAMMQNRRDYEQTFRARRIPGFGDPPRGRYDAVGDERLANVYLVPTENHDLIDYSVAVTRGDNGRWRLDTRPSEWLDATLTLDADEAVFGEYHLVGSRNHEDAPLSAGTYDFSYRDVGFSIALWPTETPGPDEESVFDSPDVPPLPNEGSTEWFHDADAGTEVYLEPSAERLEAPGRIDYTLYNRSRERLSGNPHRWGLYKLVDGKWHRIEPWAYVQPLSRVPPGDTDETSLGLYHGEAVPCDDVRTVGHLGGGRYSYHVDFAHGTETYAALFDLEAPAVDPQPDEDIEVERDDDELVVTMPEWHDDDHPPQAEIVIERASGPAERHLIPEQLFRRPMRGYRNTLPLFENGIDRITLRADRHVVGRTVGYEELEATVGYEGETFHVTGEDPLRE